MPAPPVADHVDHDVLAERLAVLEGQQADPDHGLGVVPVHVEDGGLDHPGHVRRVNAGPGVLRRGGEPHLVVHHDVHRAAGPVAAQLGQLESLGHHALAGERRVAVNQQRQHGEPGLAHVDHVLLGPDDALEHRVDRLEMARVGHQRGPDLRSVARRVLALRAEVVLDVTGPVRGGRVQVPLELAEDLRVGLADDVREHVAPAAVRHADHGLVQLLVGGLGEHGVQQRDQRLGALEREPALPDELGLQEHLERLGHVQPGQDADLLVVLGPGMRPLHAGLDPGALLRVLDVHVLDADRAAVRVPQHAEYLAQLHPRLAAEPAGRELPLQVPQGQPVLVDVQVGMLALLVLERVGIGHEVAAHPVGVDELMHPRRLRQVILMAGRDVLDPAHRLVGDPQRLEQVVVEALLTEQQPVDDPQELAGLRALDDPVVIGGGERDRLADRQPGDGLVGRALVGGRVLHRAHADDAPLAGDQPRHRVLGTDRARVGQADRGPGEVLDGELARAGLADHVLVRRPELAEVHLLRGLDAGHEQLPRPVVLAHVDGQAEVDVLGPDQHRLAVRLGVGVVHLRHRSQRPDHRVTDEVGERDLPAAPAAEVVVDHDAVVDQELGGDGAHARRRGHGEARGHVGRGAGGRPAQPDLGGSAGPARCGPGRAPGPGRRRPVRAGRRGGGGRRGPAAAGPGVTGPAPGKAARGGWPGAGPARLARPAPRWAPVPAEPAVAGGTTAVAPAAPAAPPRLGRLPWPARPGPARRRGAAPAASDGSRRRNSTRPGPPSRGPPGTSGKARPRATRWARSPCLPRCCRPRREARHPVRWTPGTQQTRRTSPFCKLLSLSFPHTRLPGGASWSGPAGRPSRPVRSAGEAVPAVRLEPVHERALGHDP